MKKDCRLPGRLRKIITVGHSLSCSLIAVTIWGIVKGPRKYLYALILAWFIPLTVSLIYFTHFKFQYWLPVALPLFSCAALILPEKLKFSRDKWRELAIRAGLILLVVAQFAGFIYQDAYAYSKRLHRAENNERIAFYTTAVDQIGAITNGPLRVYYDYRLYLPATNGWSIETTYELLDYNYIQRSQFDVLLLSSKESAIISIQMLPESTPNNTQRSFVFYTDAYNGTIQGYKLLYRNDVALIYMKDE